MAIGESERNWQSRDRSSLAPEMALDYTLASSKVIMCGPPACRGSDPRSPERLIRIDNRCAKPIAANRKERRQPKNDFHVAVPHAGRDWVETPAIGVAPNGAVIIQRSVVYIDYVFPSPSARRRRRIAYEEETR